MKRLFPLLLIGALLFPALGHASAAPIIATKTATASAQTSAISPIILTNVDVDTQLHNILNSLTDLSQGTQTAIDQISLNGIDTTQAQAALDAATTSLSKAKNTLSITKYSQKVAQDQLLDAKTNILLSLSLLKASLVTNI